MNQAYSNSNFLQKRFGEVMVRSSQNSRIVGRVDEGFRNRAQKLPLCEGMLLPESHESVAKIDGVHAVGGREHPLRMYQGATAGGSDDEPVLRVGYVPFVEQFPRFEYRNIMRYPHVKAMLLCRSREAL